ncbi:MAG TPA: hypothetical protein VK204_02065 [Nocardioidaceae bacterium]|nr:hypothetical protein [Nocardioidaceae bacterium]
MTGLLKETLREQAEGQQTPRFDVDAITAAGDRRTRHRRAAVGSLAVAAVALTAFTVPRLLDTAGTTGADAPVAGQGREVVGAFTERRPTYAVDGVIHYGRTQIAVGRTIESFVQTDDAFVFTTKNGDVWLCDGQGSERVGHSGNSRLRADDTGSLVAWVDAADDGHPQYVVFDTSSRKEVARVDDNAAGPSREPEDRGAEVFAVDDGAAYWRTQDGLVRYDVATGTSKVLQPDALGTIVDVASGHFAHKVWESDGGSSGLRVSTDLEHPAPPLPSGYDNAVLSPSARYISGDDGDETTVYDVATRAVVTPGIEGYAFAAAYAWLDDRTLTMIGIKRLGGVQPIDILECTVPKGRCTVAADDVATYDESGPVTLALPVGQRIDE